ncbi:MAG TPA: chemotaxis protein CheX [Tepidisphaeraceae bacterium]|jgi:chemotaxis protein CheX|nr:chemotaxis protein CheX [Tepidisphaeraceae bacterium]
MNFTSEELFELVQAVWGNALALSVAPAPADRSVAESQPIAASIRILGSWNGAVLLECTAELTRWAAAILFEMPPEQVTDAEMQDAVVELVNLIADQLADDLPTGCRLLLPARVENSGWAGLVGDWPVGRSAFCCRGQQASLAIVEEIRPRAIAA